MKSLLIATLLQMIMIFSLSGESVKEISDSYDNSINKWLNGEISSSRVISLMKELENRLEMEVESKETLYLQAKAALIRGQIWLQEENAERSISALETCWIRAEQSLKYKDYSDGWRLISEAGSYIMLQKGIGYIIKNSKSVKQHSEKALELDDSNARASMIIAQGLINAPAIFGGNKKKGISILEEQKRRTDITDVDRYYILLVLSDVYKSERRDVDALENYNIILRYYPGSLYVRSLIDGL